MSKKKGAMSRRDFLKLSVAGLAAVTIVPGSVLGKAAGKTAPSDKLNVAGVGVGGRGAGVLRGMEEQVNVVALADVDWKYALNTFERYPDAKRYRDYRKMYDEMGKKIDAVMVATADHTHAIIAADAMTLGKHVYVEKPLTHSVYESRLLTRLADKYDVATQMGNQGASGEGVRQICSWIWHGEIGEVTRVEAFTNRPTWPQGLERPAGEPVPETLDWDLFTGPARMRPYNHFFTPWNWRGWWDYGTGALGDMACHILHPVFKALQLGYPVSVDGSSTLLMADCAPSAQMVKYLFPARENLPRVAMPQVEVTWYDGGLKPARPVGMPDGRNLDDGGGGVIFHGTKDTLICGCYGRNPWLLSGRTPEAPEVLRVVPGNSHELDFVRACKEKSKERVQTASPFSEAGPFNEMVVMGVLAVRLQGLNKTLQWDGANMRFTNIGDGEEIKLLEKNGFADREDGRLAFDRKWSEPVNAKAFAEELIRHNYREGWKLPDMP